MNAKSSSGGRGSRLRGGRESILAAGRDVFLLEGYGASVDAVAKAAGVARRTVFNHFGSKDALFEEIMVRNGEVSVPKLVLDNEGDTRSRLLSFAQRYVAAITGPAVVGIYRMLRTGNQQSIQRLYELQREHNINVRNMLAVFFADCIEAGEMKRINTKHAAERFLASIVGMSRIEVSLGIDPARDDRDMYVTNAVDGFLEGVLAT